MEKPRTISIQMKFTNLMCYLPIGLSSEFNVKNSFSLLAFIVAFLHYFSDSVRTYYIACIFLLLLRPHRTDSIDAPYCDICRT